MHYEHVSREGAMTNNKKRNGLEMACYLLVYLLQEKGCWYTSKTLCSTQEAQATCTSSSFLPEIVILS